MLFSEKFLRFTSLSHIHVIDLDCGQDMSWEFYWDLKLLTNLVLLQYLSLNQKLSKKILSYHVMQSDFSCSCISDCDLNCVFLLFLNNKMLNSVLLFQNNKNVSSKITFSQSVLLFQNNKNTYSKTIFSQHWLQVKKIENVRQSLQKQKQQSQ